MAVPGEEVVSASRQAKSGTEKKTSSGAPAMWSGIDADVEDSKEKLLFRKTNKG